MSQPRQSTSRLLILEDEKPLLELLTTMLELRGWKCVKAGAAANMAAGFGKSRVDAALLDVNAGETNGLAVAERLRQANPDLPVVMMTGYADEGCAGACPIWGTRS